MLSLEYDRGKAVGRRRQAHKKHEKQDSRLHSKGSKRSSLCLTTLVLRRAFFFLFFFSLSPFCSFSFIQEGHHRHSTLDDAGTYMLDAQGREVSVDAQHEPITQVRICKSSHKGLQAQFL